MASPSLLAARPVPSSRRLSALLVGPAASILLALAFGSFYGWLLHLRHAGYDTYAFDLGLLSQVSWNSLHGRWFDTSIMAFNYLAEHFAPSLVLFSPLFLVWPSAESLLMLQAAAVAATGVGVYLVGRERTGDGPSGLLLQLGYHLAPVTIWVMRDEFHPISLALPAITFATALLWRRRYGAAALVAGLALLANEDAALWVAPFGLLVVLVGRRRGLLAGGLLTLVASAWLVGYLMVLAPAVRPASLGESVPHPDVGAFSQCGRSLAQVAYCLVRDPVATFHRGTTPGDLEAISSLAGPTAGLGLFGPSALVALPRALVLLLGNDPPNYRGHYAAILAPVVFLGAAETIGWLRRRASRRAVARVLAGLVALCSAFAYAQAFPSPLSGGSWLPSAEAAARSALLDQAVGLVPTDERVSVAATSSLLPHLALRERVYLIFEGKPPPADYRVYEARDAYPLSREELRFRILLTQLDPCYQPLLDRDGVYVFKRECRPPDRSVGQTYGGMIRLVGYGIAPSDGSARLELRWRLEAPTPTNYHFFVHLVGPDGRTFSQQDGEVAGGQLPTTRWEVGAEARDTVTLPAPPPAEWGGYHFSIGWYDLTSGARLKLPNGSDSLTLPLQATR